MFKMGGKACCSGTRKVRHRQAFHAWVEVLEYIIGKRQKTFKRTAICHPLPIHPHEAIITLKPKHPFKGMLYSDVHKWWAKQNLVTFFVNQCVLAAARGVGRERFREKGGHLLLPPHPPTTPSWQCYYHTLVYKKKSLDFISLITYGHHCTGFGGETKTGVILLVLLQDWPMFSHIKGKLSPRSFEW